MIVNRSFVPVAWIFSLLVFWTAKMDVFTGIVGLLALGGLYFRHRMWTDD